MPARKATDASQQPMLLIWESDVVRAGDNTVQVVARMPLFRMSTKQAAKVLGCTTWTVRKLYRLGLLEGYKPGAAVKRKDGKGSNAALVLDAGSVLAYKERCKREA